MNHLLIGQPKAGISMTKPSKRLQQSLTKSNEKGQEVPGLSFYVACGLTNVYVYATLTTTSRLWSYAWRVKTVNQTL
jgi:hypothetical protein